MKILLDHNELGDEYKKLTLPELLSSVKNNLQDRILKQIFINKVEVNERYLNESLLEKDDIESIKFITQDTKDLIKETLDEIENYLPVLRDGVLDASMLFRKGSIKEANEKYQLVLKGIEWYLQVISNIIKISGDEEVYIESQNNLDKLNKALTDLMVAHKKDDIILVADMLEYDIVDYIQDLIRFNKDSKPKFLKEESEE